jgi:hypothetical protein
MPETVNAHLEPPRTPPRSAKLPSGIKWRDSNLTRRCHLMRVAHQLFSGGSEMASYIRNFVSQAMTEFAAEYRRQSPN